MWHTMWGWGGMWFGWLVWLAIIGLIIWGVKSMVNKSQETSTQDRDQSPLEILKKRYARGEISDEEFEEKKRRLQA